MIGSKKIHQANFQSLRWRLLLSYLTVMAAILGVFAAGVYVFFTRSYYQQMDEKLRTLAQAATPSLAEIKQEGNDYLERVDEVPWRDLFNRDRQSLEWFNSEGTPLASRGQVSLDSQPETGALTERDTAQTSLIRTYTISVFSDPPNDSSQPSLEGYIRASQSMEALQAAQNQLIWGLGMGGIVALGFVGIGGLWLTKLAIQPVEKSYQQLKQFTADASHELRSPIAAIKTSVDVIRSHPERIHPKDAKKLAAIASASAQMTELVEDLLFLARTDATTVREQTTVSLNEILQDLLQWLEPLATAKGINLQADLDLSVSVFGDAAQLNRLFANLLENALQYTPQGGKVTVSLAKQNRFAVVNIKDTGIGISPEQLPYIFDRFWRADKARSRREGGTGLGLAIASAIATQHKGKITVTSQVGVGSCFQLRLPLERSN
ncbi:sensor histidine kinase [Oscillatoria salina]|uniref:sensor histidine kinase n=1 Tax=Oscillatoria salina TaxID=331517 RepID=UPI001CCDEC1F|nr:HAMP domain-containing sensor histidine kinase [Oscillatoria salina]MBZ8182432.1 two-component sensor histidine kinase [Oscillatoria salina IIICB1]